MADSDDNWREYIEWTEGADITQQEEETQVDHVKMETMPEKVALTEGRNIQELIIGHIVCTAVKYRSIRRHGAPVNSCEVDCKSYETIGMEIPYGKICRPPYGERAVQ